MNASQTKYAISRITLLTEDRVNVMNRALTNEIVRHASLKNVTVQDFIDNVPLIATKNDRTCAAGLDSIFDMTQLKEMAAARYQAKFPDVDISDLGCVRWSVRNPLTGVRADETFVNNALLPKLYELQSILNTASDKIMLATDSEAQLIISNF